MAINTTDFVNDVLALVTDIASGEKMQLSQAIIEKTEEYSSFENSISHTILTGIRNGNVIPILSENPNPESFPFNNATDCTVPDCDLEIKGSTHKWETGLIECRVGVCLRTFEEDFRKFFNGNVNDFDEDTNSALMQYLVNQFKMNFNIAKWRVAYFGEKAKIGASANFYNGFDGFLIQQQANPTQIIDITQNAGVDFTAQKTITGLDIYNYLVAMDTLYSEQIWNEGGALEYRMTKLTAQILSNYMNGLKDKTCCDGVEIVNPDNIGMKSYGLNNLSFRGIPIRVIPEWDFLINNASGLNGGGGNNARQNPHIIMLTYANNLLVGTESIDSLEHFDLWYERKDKKIYMEGGARFGTGVPLDNFILAI